MFAVAFAFGVAVVVVVGFAFAVAVAVVVVVVVGFAVAVAVVVVVVLVTQQREKSMKEDLCDKTVREIETLAAAELARRNAAARAPTGPHPYVVGACYLIRTVTMTLLGRLEYVGDKELMLSDASWIADTGRFHAALKDPSVLKEIEPSDDPVIVGRGAIVDVWVWRHTLPRETK